MHGEVDFITAMDPGTVLDAGCGTGRIAIELARRGFDVTGIDLDADMVAAAMAKAPGQSWRVDDLARMQLPRRFDTVAMPGNVMLFCEPADRRLIVHNLAQHLLPGGCVVAGFSLERGGYTIVEWDEHCAASGLELVERFATWTRLPFAPGGDYHVSVHRRINRFTVHDLLAEARAGLQRMTVGALGATPTLETGAGLGIVVVDTRDVTDRLATGWIPGSMSVPRTVLEWRLDASGGYSEPLVTSREQVVVVVCADGYSSSMSAANLQRLGFINATDLVGGFAAWARAGMPIEGGP